MSVSEGEGGVVLGVAFGFLCVGFLVSRFAVALVPVGGAAGFLAATRVSDDLYSRIPEDVQATVVFALLVGTALALVGVALRRLLDSREGRALIP